MFQSSTERAREERNELVSASVAIALLAVLFLVFAFAPARDQSKVVAGIPCSIFSERQVGEVFAAPMRLRPTDGTICQYVSTDSDKQGMLFVIARHDDPATSKLAGHGLVVRHANRTYSLIAIADPAHPDAAALQQHLALLLERRVVANRR
jgi:hypothetical protein